MSLIFSADDYGLSKKITDDILEGVDHRVLNSVSMISNGYAFDYAIAEFKKRSGCRLSVHLNLIEGQPLSPASKIPLLIDQNGLLSLSFSKLTWFSFFGSRAKKQELTQQITTEFRNQIERIQKAMGTTHKWHVDSHQHLHTIPLVLDAVVNLIREGLVNSVRLPEEPFYFVARPLSSIFNYLSPNVIKHVLLNFLSRRARKVLGREACVCNQSFIGVLFTGRMQREVVLKNLESLPDLASSQDVEFLFHPGGAGTAEQDYWRAYPHLKTYYNSAFRQREKHLVATLKTDPEFQKLRSRKWASPIQEPT